MRFLLLFSPSIVLVIMTVVVAVNGQISDRALVAFLGVLAVAVTAAEVMRIEPRRRK